jgi:hypothetical protein
MLLIAKQKNTKTWTIIQFDDSEDIPEDLEWDKIFVSYRLARKRLKELNKEG